MVLHRTTSSGNTAATADPDDGSASSFRTKRGRCYLTDDELVLESSVRGLFKRLYEGNRLVFAGYVLALLVPVVALVAGDRQFVLVGLAVGVVVVVLGRVVGRLRGFTKDDRIALESVETVTPVRGTKGLTRPRFVVRYRRDGESKRRYVMMPSLYLSYGEEAFERAESAFETRGIPVE